MQRLAPSLASSLSIADRRPELTSPLSQHLLSSQSSRVRPVPTLAWAAATALATTSLLAPSSKDAAKAEEAAVASTSTSTAAAAAAAASGGDHLYSLPAATGLFSPPPPSSPSSPRPPPLTLYQYEVCPFCCKVKAVLDFYDVPYRVVEVSPLTKRQLNWGTHRKVPVLALGEVGKDGEAFAPPPGVEVLADSSLIISRIAAEARDAGLGPAGKGESGNKSGKKAEALRPLPGSAATPAAEEAGPLLPLPLFRLLSPKRLPGASGSTVAS